jgi:cytochrome P450
MSPKVPPGPSSWIPGKQFFEFKAGRLAFLEKAAAFGDIAYYKVGSQAYYQLNEPDLIRDLLVTHAAQFHKGRALEKAKQLLGEGLITSEDPLHQRQRRLVMPAFHRQHLAGYGACMAQFTAEATRTWRDGETRDLNADLMRLTLRIVAKTLFSRELETEADEIGLHFTRVLEAFLFYVVPYAEHLLRLPLPPGQRLRRSIAFLDSMIYGLIAERKPALSLSKGTQGAGEGDLLTLLMEAKTEDGGVGMSDAQIRDECMTLYIAGHETTSNALTWTLYLLAQHPEMQSALAEECRALLGDRLPSFEDYPQLASVQRAFAEAMRLYPPVWNVPRRAMQDYSVAGYTVPKGAILFASQWVMHRHPRYFSDPLRFDPARWTPEAKAARPAFTYFPFGGGPRGCVGEGFAWMEGVLVLATLLKDWDFQLLPGQAPVQPQALLTLRPKGGMPLRLRRRG